MGDNDISRQFDGAGQRRDFDLRLSTIYGFSRSTEQFAGSSAVETTSPQYRVDLHLITLIASAEHRSGAGMGLVFPWGAILRRDRPAGGAPTAVQETYDVGPGDLELRARQDVGRLFGLQGKYLPRLVVSLGAVTPSGPYIPKSTIVAPGETAPPETDKYASLGRGVWWLTADAELFGALATDVGWYAAFYTRTSLNLAENGFDWGPERRTSLGLSWRFWPGRLGASLGADWQHRGLSTELVYDPLVGEKVRTTFISGGGDWVDLLPSLRADLVGGLAATFTARFPVYRNVEGLQGVQGPAAFVGLQYAFGVGEVSAAPLRPALTPMAAGDAPTGPAVANLLVPGRFTIVDYWATWCAPCLQLSPELEEFAGKRPDIVLAKLDVTAWDQPDLDRYLPGVPGIPVVDLWGPDGKLVKRLIGPQCNAFRTQLPLPPQPTP